MSVVTSVYSIRIEDGNDLEDKLVSEYLSLLRSLIKNEVKDSIEYI